MKFISKIFNFPESVFSVQNPTKLHRNNFISSTVQPTRDTSARGRRELGASQALLPPRQRLLALRERPSELLQHAKDTHSVALGRVLSEVLDHFGDFAKHESAAATHFFDLWRGSLHLLLEAGGK